MRKSIVLLGIVLMIFASGCNPASRTTDMSAQNSDKEKNNIESDMFLGDTEQSRNTEKILQKASKKSLDRLIKTSYPQKELIASLSYLGTDNFNTSLHWLNNNYPVECIRTPQGFLTYCVYKLEEGGLLFVFFHGEELKSADYIFVVKEPLAKENFDGIQKGMTLADVEAVDPGTKLVNAIYTEYLTMGKTFHMVKDGFIAITYTQGGRSPSSYVRVDIDMTAYQVDTVQFIPNGGVLNTFEEYKYSFLPEDYPD